MMKHGKTLLALFILLAITFTSFAGASDTWEGKGRIAFSSDGNYHDHDDIQATKMSMMIIAREGLQDKLVLYTYADHIWGSNDQLEKMHTVALGSQERFGFHDANFMAAVENPTAAYNAMAEVIAVSTADDPLFIVAAGPMQVVGEGLRIANNTNPSALNYVTVISHSVWNNNHGQSHKDPETVDHDGWTWDMMKSSFGSKVNFKKISDQNGTGNPPECYKTNNKFKAADMSYWDWMKNHQDPNVNWVYENHTGKGSISAADYSDAGMAFYLITGDEMGNPVKLKEYIGSDIIAVTPADPTKVSRVNLNIENYHIKELGGTFQLTASILPETAVNKSVTWSSENTAIATVSPTGLITGHSFGYTTISVKTVDGNRSDFCSIQVGDVEAGDYQAGDDYISFEAEWTKSDLQNWKLRQPGFDDYVEASSGVAPINNTYLEYTGGNENGNTEGQDILVYKFKPQTDGKYWLTGRMAQNQNGAAWDKCNDIYVKMEGDFTSGNNTPEDILRKWTKLYGRGLEDWGAFVQLDVNHTKYKPVYNLKAGVEYTFSVSGRATRTCVDYYLFYKDGSAVTVAEKKDLATHSPEYMRPGIASGPTCMTIKAHDFTNIEVSGYDKATKGTIPGSPSNGINKGEPVIGCGGSNGLTKPIAAEITYNGSSAGVTFTVKAVGEPDGECTYEIYVNDEKVGEKQATRIHGTDVAPYTYEDLMINTDLVAIEKGDVIRVTSNQVSNNLVPEGDSYATARGRWVSIDICGEGVVPPAEENVMFGDLPPAFSTSDMQLPIKVKYAVNEERDINVAIKSPEDKFIKNKTVTVQKGSGTKTITIELDEALTAANGYKLNVALRPVGGDWNTNLDSQDATVNFIDGAVLPTEDKVDYIDAPKEFGNDVLVLPVAVTYQATQERDINVEIKTPDNKYLINNKVTVAAGYGDTIVNVQLASNLAIANGYKMILSIRPVGGNWQTNIDRKDITFDITDTGVQTPTDEIDYVDMPTSFMNTTMSFPIAVKYHTTLQRDFCLELKDAEFKHLGDTTITMEAGEGTTSMTLDLPGKLKIADGYQFILTIRKVGGDWTTNITRKDATFNITDAGSGNGETTVVISLDSAQVDMGKTLQLSANSDPLGETITWATSDAAIATVSDQGLVTGIKEGQVTITASIANGAKAECIVNVIDKTSKQAINSMQIALYPNPTTGIVNFENNGGISDISVFNLQGKVILKQIANPGLNSISLNEFDNGIYFIKMQENNDFPIITKLVKR